MKRSIRNRWRACKQVAIVSLLVAATILHPELAQRQAVYAAEEAAVTKVSELLGTPREELVKLVEETKMLKSENDKLAFSLFRTIGKTIATRADAQQLNGRLDSLITGAQADINKLKTCIGEMGTLAEQAKSDLSLRDECEQSLKELHDKYEKECCGCYAQCNSGGSGIDWGKVLMTVLIVALFIGMMFMMFGGGGGGLIGSIGMGVFNVWDPIQLEFRKTIRMKTVW